MAPSVKNVVLICLGTLSLILGMVGIIIPVLPTTPFLLLAAFCYLRSSKGLYNWLTHHRIFGNYIVQYMSYKALPRRAKISALIFLWLSLAISIVLIPGLHLRILLLAVGLGVSVHLLMLKTMGPEKADKPFKTDCDTEDEA